MPDIKFNKISRYFNSRTIKKNISSKTNFLQTEAHETADSHSAKSEHFRSVHAGEMDQPRRQSGRFGRFRHRPHRHLPRGNQVPLPPRSKV